MFEDQSADRLQNLVAHAVAVLIIDFLELVQVQQQQRHRDAVTVAALAFAPQRLVEVMAVVETGEAVGDRITLDGVERVGFDDRGFDELGTHVENEVQ